MNLICDPRALADVFSKVMKALPLDLEIIELKRELEER
jgi:hypothetical protein